MKKNESVFEYLIAVKELALRGSIEPEFLVQYIINEITDDVDSKAMMYGT